MIWTRRPALACLAAGGAAVTAIVVLVVRDDRTTFFAQTLYLFALSFGLFGFCVLLPIGWAGWERRHSARVATTLVVAIYALTTLFLGMFAYMVIPAVYTRDHRWSAPPHSSPLGAIHVEMLERAAIPDAIPPENAPAIRKMVRDERRAFFGDWLRLSLIGLVLPAAVLLLRLYVARRTPA